MTSSIPPLRQDSTDASARAEINMSQIRVGGGIPGLIFAAGTVYIFFAGVPEVRWFLGGAISVGLLLSVALRLFHRYKPTRPAARIAN
jgi:hypothetical protein